MYGGFHFDCTGRGPVPEPISGSVDSQWYRTMRIRIHHFRSMHIGIERFYEQKFYNYSRAKIHNFFKKTVQK
jgi:hypothetical protein